MNQSTGHMIDSLALCDAKAGFGAFYYFYFYTTPSAVSFSEVSGT